MALPSENASNTKNRNIKLIMAGLLVLVLVGIAGIYAMSASSEPDAVVIQQPADEQVQELESKHTEEAEQHTELFVETKNILEDMEVDLATHLQSCNDISSEWRELVTKLQKSEITPEEFLENNGELILTTQQYNDDTEFNIKVWSQTLAGLDNVIHMPDTEEFFVIKEGVFSASEEDILTEHIDAQYDILSDMIICINTKTKYYDMIISILEDMQERIPESIDVEENTQQLAECNLLCDHTGHEPSWVTSDMDLIKVAEVCTIIIDTNTYGNPDWNWCDTIVGYMLHISNESSGIDQPAAEAGCNLFCDHTGYEPRWVTNGMGPHRAMELCESVDMDAYGNPNRGWCGELAGYVLDGSNKSDKINQSAAEAGCNIFCDHTGYEPTWAISGMGLYRTAAICAILETDTYRDLDQNWCNEFIVYVLDDIR